MKSRVGLVTVFLLPLMALAQTTEQQIKNEAELAAALCHVERNERSRDALLEKYPKLIDSRLWEDVTGRAATAYYQESPEGSLKIYEVSIQVATKLRDPKLLARTYYNLGRTLSGLNQPDKAIESY
jgi:tetratricopeptide (TPR) repeat protein